MDELRRPDPGELSPTAAGDRAERIVLDEGATLLLQRTELAVVVQVAGLADGGCIESLALELLAFEPDEKLVLDINDATLINPVSLCELLSALCEASEEPQRLCLVCERLSALVLLRKYGAGDHCAIFATVNDALQAALLHAEGYGDGWAPTRGR